LNFFGAIGGYFGGKVDALIMWFVNIIWSIPYTSLVCDYFGSWKGFGKFLLQLV
jgi:ABC-type microcin C transport system permease subunit YejE